VTVNRIIQSILQHPKFLNVGQANGHIARSKLVAILHSLFHMHPMNTCQPSHMESILSLYGGTISEADRRLLLVFKLFERVRKTSATSLLVHWSAVPDVPSATALEAIQSLDGTRTLRTCLQFPHHASVSDLTTVPSSDIEDIYDTTFIILLFNHVLYEGLPVTAPSWVQLFRTNVVGLLIRCLSSYDNDVRSTTLTQLIALYAALQVCT
jgi:nucleolar pre-ribosomal-associated protein 1